MKDVPEFDELLKQVSRTFYLSVRLLPRGLRSTVGLAFLFCKAGDTIADTRLLPVERRLEILERYHALFAEENRALFIEPNMARITGSTPDPEFLSSIAGEIRPEGGSQGERTLLERIPALYRALEELHKGDRTLIRSVAASVTEGMTMDLRKFPNERSGRPEALLTRVGLDLYCYLVAGSVGEFWTKIHHAHRPALRTLDVNRQLIRAVRFGKGLQMTNILRDIAADLRRGRCYLPMEDLKPADLTPDALRDPASLPALRPVIRTLVHLTMGHLDAGLDYVIAIPRREWRLRAASLIPLLLALDTLRLVANSDDLLSPDRIVKVNRADVSRIVRTAFSAVLSNRAVHRVYEARRSRLQEGIVKAHMRDETTARRSGGDKEGGPYERKMG